MGVGISRLWQSKKGGFLQTDHQWEGIVKNDKAGGGGRASKFNCDTQLMKILPPLPWAIKNDRYLNTVSSNK